MKITNCRLCHSLLKKPALVLPNTPLANEFLSSNHFFSDLGQDLFPLEVCFCSSCGHYQLTESVDPNRLFRNYLFESGTSPSNVEHFRQYAEEIVKRFKIKPGSLIVDIASNDATLLRHFKNMGMQVVGVDPAINLATKATKEGIYTIAEFFTPQIAESIYWRYGKASLICANNIIAHTDHVIKIIQGVKSLLSDDGIFSFEVSYFKDVVEKNLFDTIYHEHTHYHSIRALKPFFENLGLALFDVDLITNHGGSIRGYVGKNRSYYPIIGTLIQQENELGFGSNKPLLTLKKKINTLKKLITKRLKEIQEKGKSIAIYGVPAKTTTMLYAFGIGKEVFEEAFEDATLKIGTFTPGLHIPVVKAELEAMNYYDYLFIGAWNFADSIIKNHPNYKGKWIVPLPEYREI